MARIKGIKIDGFKETYKAMGLLEEEIQKVALKSIAKYAEVILGESQKLVPVDSGTLRRSGVVTTGGLPENSEEIYEDAKNGIENLKGYSSSKAPIVTISYNTPYARKQHEDNTLNHPKEGQAKYLEQPFNEKSEGLEKFVKEKLKKKYGK